jgi:hypothetical protein
MNVSYESSHSDIRNGYFTSELIQAISRYGHRKSLGDIVCEVHACLEKAKPGRQTPSFYASATATWVLVPLVGNLPLGDGTGVVLNNVVLPLRTAIDAQVRDCLPPQLHMFNRAHLLVHLARGYAAPTLHAMRALFLDFLLRTSFIES